jgi:hypothetical protein
MALGWAQQHLMEVNYDAPPDDVEPACAGCGELADKSALLLFQTMYPRGQERRDFYGRVHLACRQAAEDGMGLSVQMPLIRSVA